MNYPYKCYYLRLLANSNPNLRCRKPAWEITEQMKEWLSENVNDYYWSKQKDWCSNVTCTNRSVFLQLKFPVAIYFKNEIDLLAFRLRWGING